jgi:adapter protein MecA 1/2
MKIEKINENQIRCTLTKEDLADRNIKISELAYGTGKTRELFQDMMQQANDDFGFEVNDIPLMVEAIPVSSEGIILVVTKVDDPEETEAHLSKFFPSEFKDKFKDSILSHLDDLELNLDDIEEIDENIHHSDSESAAVDESSDDADSLLYSIYSFDNLSDIISIANIIALSYVGDSSVYKSPFDNRYYLSLCVNSSDENMLNKICGILTEHGRREIPTYAKELFFMEHFEEIIDNNAIEKLGQI